MAGEISNPEPSSGDEEPIFQWPESAVTLDVVRGIALTAGFLLTESKSAYYNSGKYLAIPEESLKIWLAQAAKAARERGESSKDTELRSGGESLGSIANNLHDAPHTELRDLSLPPDRV